MPEALFRHQDGQNLAELRNFKLVEGQLFKVNGKNYYFGVTPYPVTPAKGDVWTEYDGSDNFIENWVYNGSIWISENTDSFFQNSGLINTIFPLTPNFNLLLTDFKVAGVQTATATATDRRQWVIDRLVPIATAVTIGTFASNTGTVFIGGRWDSVVYPINLFVNVAATNSKALRINQSSNGASTKGFDTVLQYKKVRL